MHEALRVGVIGILQRAAMVVSPDAVMAVALMVGGAVILVLGAPARRTVRWGWVGPGLFLLLAGGWLSAARLTGRSPLMTWWAGVGAAAAAVLLAHVLWGRAAGPEPSRRESGRLVAPYAVIAWTLAALLLVDELRRCAGAMLVWEPPVIAGFGEALRRGTGVLRFAVERLLWDDGLVSRGDTSLLYGGGTYALFHLGGVSMWTLRSVAALAAMLSVPVLFLAVRRTLGVATAAVAATLLAVSPVLLFYGCYGTSLTGTLLGSLAALGGVLWLLDRGWRRWWGGAVCGAVLFVATLGYSPVRPVVLALAVQAVVTLTLRGRRLGRRGAVSLTLLLAVLGGAWWVQDASGTASAFVRARGENILNFTKQEGYIREYLGREITPAELRPADRVALTWRVLQRTVPQLENVLANAFLPAVDRKQQLAGDPPRLPLLAAALLPFVLWGALLFLRRPWAPAHLATWAWTAAVVGPVLLTTRADIHRIMLLVVPAVLWGGTGLVEAGRTLDRVGAPRFLGHGLATILLAAAVLANAADLSDGFPPADPLAGEVAAELGHIDGPVAVAATGDHRTVGWIDLELLERLRRPPHAPGRIMPERDVVSLLQPSDSPPLEYEVGRLLSGRDTVLLVPAEVFRRAASAFEARGAAVVRLGRPDAAFWRVDPLPAVGVGPAGGTAAEPTLPPTSTPVSLSPGREGRIWLGDLQPLEVAYGFEPPTIDRSWGGGPLVLGGVHHLHGIGMHAWTRMTYAVPPGARAFEAVVGLADSQRGCPAALVTFEVRGARGEVLFDSGAVGPVTPPRAVEVEVGGQPAITLAATEGGNGRSCDHASWAEAAFLVDDG